MDTVSIIVTTYNRVDLVERAVESALSQTGVHEVVVVDDGSTDETPAVLARLGNGVRVVRQVNAGASAARNAGAVMATGAWLGFLDDDDRLLEGWLLRMREAAASDAAAAIACCAARYVDSNGKQIGVALPEPLGPAFGNHTALFLAGSFLVRRAVFLAAGGYAEALKSRHQTELGLRLTRHLDEHSLRVANIDDPLVEVTVKGPTARFMASPEALYQGARMVIDRHRDRLALDPRRLAEFYSVAGVSAARLGRYPEARRLLLRAARARPREGRRWVRVGLAAVPAVGDRIWRSAAFRSSGR